MRHYGGGQSDQDEGLDNYCHVNSVSRTFHSGSKGHVIIIASFFKHKLC